jgi:hypothetical protein
MVNPRLGKLSIFYSMISRPETSKVHQINKIEQKIEDYQQYDAMTR